MLEVNEIHTYYGTSHILFGISFDVKQGEAVCLLGRNGAGKTTTFRSIIGLTPPKKGSIKFRGQEIIGKPSYRIAKMGIRYVPDTRRIFPDLTVRQNNLVARREKEKAIWNLETIYALYPKLRELDTHMGTQLSGGEQQMLTVARTLMTNPELLLLDEPGEGLAPLVIQAMKEHDLVVPKTVDDATPDEGQAIAYTVTVRNNGPAQATALSLDDVLPVGVTAAGAPTPSQGSWSAPTWTIGTLASGATATLTIPVTVNAGTSGDTITNAVANIVLDQLDSNATPDTPSVDIAVNNGLDLVVTKTVDDATPDEGQAVTYTVTVTNNGPAQATALSMDDVLPAGVTAAGAPTPSQGSWSAARSSAP